MKADTPFCEWTLGARDCQYWPLFVPVAGPFIALGPADVAGAEIAVLLLDGLVQVGGLVRVVVGVARPRTVLVRGDLAVQPMPLADGLGMSLSGAF